MNWLHCCRLSSNNECRTGGGRLTSIERKPLSPLFLLLPPPRPYMLLPLSQTYLECFATRHTVIEMYSEARSKCIKSKSDVIVFIYKGKLYIYIVYITIYFKSHIVLNRSHCGLIFAAHTSRLPHRSAMFAFHCRRKLKAIRDWDVIQPNRMNPALLYPLFSKQHVHVREVYIVQQDIKPLLLVQSFTPRPKESFWQLGQASLFC